MVTWPEGHLIYMVLNPTVPQQEEQRRSDGSTRIRHSPDHQVDPQHCGRSDYEFGYQFGIRIREGIGSGRCVASTRFLGKGSLQSLLVPSWSVTGCQTTWQCYSAELPPTSTCSCSFALQCSISAAPSHAIPGQDVRLSSKSLKLCRLKQKQNRSTIRNLPEPFKLHQAAIHVTEITVC